MDVPSRAAFARRLQRLDRRRFTSFVAALWRARGWLVTRDDTGRLVATRDRGESESVIIHVGERAPNLPLDDDPSHLPDIVVTAQRTVPADERSSGRIRVVTADDLYIQLRYAVDRTDRRKLEARLPADPMSPLLGAVRSIEARAVSFPRSPIRTTGVVLLTVAVILAGFVGIPSGLSTPDQGPSTPVGHDTSQSAAATVTPIPLDAASRDVRRTDDSSPERIPPPALTVPEVCPEPPADAHPRALALRVGPSANRSSARIWEPVGASSADTFDPISPMAPGPPEARFAATYRMPSGARFHVTIDKWPSAQRAEAVQLELAGAGHATMDWGRYHVRIDGYGADGARLSGAAAIAPAYTLLAAVNVPAREEPIGTACVTALARDPNA